MTGPAAEQGGTRVASKSDWVPALLVILALQVASSVLARLVPTLAPALALQLGWTVGAIGYLASVLTFGSIVFLVLGRPWVRRIGALPTLQLCLVIGALGALLCSVPAGVAMIVGSLLMGWGIAPSNSVANELMQREFPRHRMNLIFSIKQAGVPLGGVMAGLCLPVLVRHLGTTGTIVTTAGIVAATVVVAEPMRRRLLADNDPTQSLGWRHFLSFDNAFGAVVAVWRTPGLRRLAFAGLCLAACQAAWVTFFVTYAVEVLQRSLVEAGAAFALMQFLSVLGRPLLGGLADRVGSTLTILRAAALASVLSTLSWALARPDWPPSVLIGLAAVAGLSVASWNGIQMAEVARLAHSLKVRDGVVGATLFLFIGFIGGPAGFGLVLGWTDNYRIAILAIALVSAIAIPALWSRSAGSSAGA
jgi:MFS family permease